MSKIDVDSGVPILPLAIHGSVKGHLRAHGNTSGVFFIEEPVTGTLEIDKVGKDVELIMVTLTETENVVKNVVHQKNPDQVDHGLNNSHSIFSQTMTIQAQNIFISEEATRKIPFFFNIAGTAAPTARRHSQSPQPHSDVIFNAKAEISCHLIVSIQKTGRPGPKVVAQTSINLIHSKIPEHLQSEVKLEWPVGPYGTLKCLSPRMQIGKSIDFLLTAKDFRTLKSIVSAQVYQRMLCAGQTVGTSPKPLGSKFIYDTVVGIHSQLNSSTEFDEAGSDHHVIPLWTIDTAVSDAQSIAKRTDDTEDRQILFSLTVPANVGNQGFFSTPRVLNYWTVVLRMDRTYGGLVQTEDIHVGPLPIVWSVDTNVNSLKKEHHDCIIL